MRVTLFFDGKNFHAGWKERAGSHRIDFPALARWLVSQCGGGTLRGAYYFTGVETGTAAGSEGQRRLESFLDMLEAQPGYFVRAFARRSLTTTCPACGCEGRVSVDKEVDTALVAEMLQLASVDAFDGAVLLSGDGDHTPAVDALRAMGKQAFVATWGGTGLSHRIRRAAFAHVDLLAGLAEFSTPRSTTSADREMAEPAARGSFPIGAEPARLGGGEHVADDASLARVFLGELRRAEERFRGGFVGMNYFVTRWRSDQLDESPEVRRRILDRLLEQEQVESYATDDGQLAIRAKTVP